ncbi:MAG: enoyl-CoA hydratase/isomerase family protein [Acidimicrobiales bacterium]
MAAGSLRSTKTGRVMVWVIDRPAVRNALDPPTLFALADAVDTASADATIGAAVITGAGTECFTSGVDLRAVQASGDGVADAVRRFHRSMTAPSRVPIVAAVRGMAVGGGFELMLLCDLVVAAQDARFGLPEVDRGLVPGGGGTLLPARVALAVALELGLLGEAIEAPRALALGLVNRLSPPSRVVGDAIELAGKLAAKPPATLRRIRELMWVTATAGPRAGAEASSERPADPRLRAEAVEGIARFLDGARDRAERLAKPATMGDHSNH